ncbi:hypothetical protein [Terriglobus roseus]|uniref:2-polyprenyl-6-methoxyphenol hydroxylase n=1 Tax=Terriglobus roseus TaxID=392734 RepID=A0A1G7HZJ5_9BACT|nr:hypothetical protein [Terriglobus roseus]SDF05835.1 2-polyprenyl-6-methoxyphenol hydroxylase [Terriglobus roseus]
MSALVCMEGDGIASVCLTRLLRDAGVACIGEKTQRPKVAAILLSQATQYLLHEIFPIADAGDALYAGFLPIRRRIVLWGNAKEAVSFPHLGLVAPEDVLLERLWDQTSFDRNHVESEGCAWKIKTLGSNASIESALRVGERYAHIAVAQLLPTAPDDACWVESTTNGWLFLLPRGEGQATLMAVGDTPQVLLQDSRLISHQLDSVTPTSALVPASSQLALTLTEPGIIACGSAAMSFDPLCGEGAGNAIREAFLAAAVIRAGLAGHPIAELAEHYESRLCLGFARHLEVCLQFYQSGGTSDFWREQVDVLNKGAQYLSTLLTQASPPRYRLVGRDLIPIDRP